MIVCICHDINNKEIENIIEIKEIKSIRNLQKEIDVCKQCKSCSNMIQSIIMNSKSNKISN